VSGLAFSEQAAQHLVAVYSTPDVVAQRDAILQRLALRGGERVLDIGSGPGFLCESMAEAVGPSGRIAGIELSDDLVRYAQSRKTSAWLDYRCGDAAALNLEGGSFDVAVSTQVLEYVPDVPAALREMHRVLRSGGRGLIVDTDWDSVVWHSSDRERMERVLRAWESHCAEPRLPRLLGPLLREAGFSIEAVEVYAIVNTQYDPNTYSAGMMDIIADFLAKQKQDAVEVAAWRADLAEMGRRQEYFFSINRYFLSIAKV
jgi:ubiquinone/menaquinone biosynthesis C-methylase UbiE